MLVTGLRTLPATAAGSAVPSVAAAAEDMPLPSAPRVRTPPQSPQQPPQPPQPPPVSNDTDDQRIVAEACSGDNARHIDSNSGGGGGGGGDDDGDGGGDGGGDRKEKSPARIAPVAAGPALREAPSVDGVAGAVSAVGGKGPRLIAVVNCHLTGGPAPERRMRQVLDGLDAARKEAARFLSAEIAAAAVAEGGKGKVNKKGKKGGGGGGGGAGGAAKPVGTSVPVVVCGDFNSNGRTAVWELLTQGVVEASYRERGYPEVSRRV